MIPGAQIRNGKGIIGGKHIVDIGYPFITNNQKAAATMAHEIYNLPFVGSCGSDGIYMGDRRRMDLDLPNVPIAPVAIPIPNPKGDCMLAGTQVVNAKSSLIGKETVQT